MSASNGPRIAKTFPVFDCDAHINDPGFADAVAAEARACFPA